MTERHPNLFKVLIGEIVKAVANLARGRRTRGRARLIELFSVDTMVKTFGRQQAG
jgi:hypothetical protein